MHSVPNSVFFPLHTLYIHTQWFRKPLIQKSVFTCVDTGGTPPPHVHCCWPTEVQFRVRDFVFCVFIPFAWHKLNATAAY